MIIKKLNYSCLPLNNKIGLEIKKIDEFNTNERKLINQSGLEKNNIIEGWTVIGTNQQINYSTHGLFRYFGKFPSLIAANLIDEYTKKNDYVMDPMAGSGTTAVECLLSDRNCYSFDVNPLSVLLAKVKTRYISKDNLTKKLNQIVKSYRPLTLNEFNWQPEGLKDINHWFLDETQNSIRGIIYEINKIKNSDIKDFFLICLASSIRSVSKATTQQGRLFLDVLTAQKDCLETFIKKANKSIEAVNGLPKSKNVIMKIDNHNCIEKFDKNIKTNLVIIHPPYFNSYKYSSINSLELAWMKINHADIRKSEVREFFKVGKAENVTKYVDDIVECLINLKTTLKKGSVIALMIGDTIIKGEYIQTTKLVIDKFLSKITDIEVEKVILRIPKYTEASWNASQRRNSKRIGISLDDFIVIFRKIK